MGKRKRRETATATMHPRNRYFENPPEFSLLASLYPSFSPFVFFSGHNRPCIDWTDFNATRELTRVLLHHDHSLNWWIPDGQLCPTVPNRSNYIHWIEDLVASDIIEKMNYDGADEVRGFDIGTGANCIYPLLGASLLGWSFVGSDMADIALQWAEKNVQSNPHVAHLIEIRRVENVRVSESDSAPCVISLEESIESGTDVLNSAEEKAVFDSGIICDEKMLNDGRIRRCEDKPKLSEMNVGDAQTHPLISLDEHANVDESYNGPPILLGVVKDGEKFDFCMCNPPFFESMEEAGQNPKTSCGGTPEEMVCTGGERAFISRIIEDSVALRQSFRWYTSMIGKKSNLKFLTSKLRMAGVTIVKTTEFVQGQTCRWGLAWSFMSPTRKIVPLVLPDRSNFSFMLEGLQRQVSAFSILQSIESLFCSFGASCESNHSSFTVDVKTTNNHWDLMLKNDLKDFDNVISSKTVAKVTSDSNSLGAEPNQMCLRITVFQQIPGTLLVKGSLQQKNGPASGSISIMFQRLEEFLKHKFLKEKMHIS